jgi:hemerythrin
LARAATAVRCGVPEGPMALITWKSEYSVGVAEFDNDHRHLLDLINALHDALLADAPAERLGEICDRLIEHTVVHFGHEEARFEGYPRAAEHLRMHEKLKQRVLDFRGQIGTAGASDNARLVTDWLAHHITGEDRTFGAWLNTQGIH